VSPINEIKRLSDKRVEVKLNNKKIAINKNTRTLIFELSNDLVLKAKNNFLVKLHFYIYNTKITNILVFQSAMVHFSPTNDRLIFTYNEGST
jgi:hypothetical protein